MQNYWCTIVRSIVYFHEMFVKIHTLGKFNFHTPRFLEADFARFFQFSVKLLEIQKCGLPHWKALIFSYFWPAVEWAWLSYKAARPNWMKPGLLSFKWILLILKSRYSKSHYKFPLPYVRAFFWGIQHFLWSTGSKMAACQSSKFLKWVQFT